MNPGPFTLWLPGRSRTGMAWLSSDGSGLGILTDGGHNACGCFCGRHISRWGFGQYEIGRRAE